MFPLTSLLRATRVAINRGRTPCGTSLPGTSGMTSSTAWAKVSAARRRCSLDATHVLVVVPLHGRKVDVVLLDNTRVQRVEVHDHDVRVPESTLGLKDETSLVFEALDLRDEGAVVVELLSLWLTGARLAFALVGADVFEAVEFVQQNVLVAFGARTGQRAVPGGTSESAQLHGCSSHSLTRSFRPTSSAAA